MRLTKRERVRKGLKQANCQKSELGAAIEDIIVDIHRALRSAPLIPSTTRNTFPTCQSTLSIADVVIFHGLRVVAATTKILLT